MLDGGFVKLHRSLLKWEWYDDVNTKVVFLHIILNANYVDKPWHGMIIERGQFVCSYASLAAELKLSVKQVRTALKKLISTGELAHEGQANYGIITVKNYNKFQDVAPNESGKGQSEGSPEAAQGQQPKKVKEIQEVQESKRNQEEICPLCSPEGEIKRADGKQNVSKKPQDKAIYGEFKQVKLRADEHEKLAERLGKSSLESYIARLDGWLAEGGVGRKKNSHYATILNWWRKDGGENLATDQTRSQIQEGEVPW